MDSTFREADFHSYLLSEEDVRIVGPIETPFELVQLGRREPRPVPFLLGGLVIALPDRCRVPYNNDSPLNNTNKKQNEFDRIENNFRNKNELYSRNN